VNQRLIDEVTAGYKRGWRYVPLRLNEKRPFLNGWPSLRLTLDECLAWIAKGHNLGLLTGEASGIIVVDADPGAAIQLPPTVTVRTPRGGHHYYFTAPTDPGAIKNWVGQLGPHIDVRTTGGQVVSVGSTSKRGDYQWAHSPDDTPIAPCPVALLTSLYERHQETKARQKTQTTRATRAAGYGQTALANECRMVQQATNGTRNATLNRAAFNIAQLVAGGILAEHEAYHALRNAAAVHIGDDFTMSEIETTIKSGFNAGRQKPRTAPERSAPAVCNGSGGESQYILVPGTHVDDSGQYIERGNDEFADEVLSRLPPGSVYRRSSVVGVMEGPDGYKYFRELTNDDMRILVDRNMKLGRWRKVKQGDETTPQLTYQNCLRDHAGLIIASALSHPTIRELDLITHYPVYLHGFRLAQPGYNVGGIFYDPHPSIADLQPETDRETIAATLDDLITDFPFKSAADCQNFYGLLLTPIIRPALGGNTPMHMILAPLERTGKSKLAEQVFGRIILGEPTAAIQLMDNEDEREKRILSLLLMGSTAIHLDNLSEFIDSPALASLLTASTFQGRVLGGSKMVKLPNNLTVIASGNNVKATGEIAKRTVPISLQPLDASPEARVAFTHPDLEGYLEDARCRILQVLLGMVELWRASGCPGGGKRLGGFEKWASSIGGIMRISGFTDWMTNLQEWSDGADPNGADLRTLVEIWASQYRDSELAAVDVMKIARDEGLFPGCFRGATEKSHVTSFSMKVLSRHANMPVKSWVICKVSAGNNSKYKLESVLRGGGRPREVPDIF
jgi:hypothetical protein